MTSLLTECSIMQGITKTEKAITACYDRIDELEKRLQTDELSEKTRKTIAADITEMRKLLETNQQQLSQLHKHNTKTFAIVAVFCFICFTMYALYILVAGKDF